MPTVYWFKQPQSQTIRVDEICEENQKKKKKKGNHSIVYLYIHINYKNSHVMIHNEKTVLQNKRILQLVACSDLN